MGLPKSLQTKGTDKWNHNESKVNKQMLSYKSCIGTGCKVIFAEVNLACG